jgi:ribosomal protein S18 acetylase RimI-like enzyme
VSVELVPASDVPTVRRAEIFTAAYADYFTPVHVDEATLAHMDTLWDIDLDRSRVSMLDGRPVGFANLGLRDGVGWIGGVGVVPEHRRRGIGRRLMEAVLGEAPGDVWLEVIEQNKAAVRLYEELGFTTTRMLDVWSWHGDPPAATARDVEPHAIQDDAPWQSARPNLDELEALEVDGGDVLFRPGERIAVVQLAARDVDAARELLSAARAHGSSLHYVNAPSESPASGALRALGATLDLRQFEMCLRKTNAPRG